MTCSARSAWLSARRRATRAVRRGSCSQARRSVRRARERPPRGRSGRRAPPGPAPACQLRRARARPRRPCRHRTGASISTDDASRTALSPSTRHASTSDSCRIEAACASPRQRRKASNVPEDLPPISARQRDEATPRQHIGQRGICTRRLRCVNLMASCRMRPDYSQRRSGVRRRGSLPRRADASTWRETAMRLTRRRALLVLAGGASAALAAACSTTPVPSAAARPRPPPRPPRLLPRPSPLRPPSPPPMRSPARLRRRPQWSRQGVRQRLGWGGRQAHRLDDRPGRAVVLPPRQPDRGRRRAERGAPEGGRAAAGPGRGDLRERRHLGRLEAEVHPGG